MDEQTIHDRRWWTLVVLCLSLVVVIVGNTVLNVTLPTLVRELGATSTELQWIVDAYGLVFAGLLLTGGALGDRFGRKSALTLGLIIFGFGSAVSSFATEPGHLIATRALMGLAAALVMPATLSILTTVFPPQERARAIGIWAGLAGGGAAIGPITGGWLLEHFWWGSVFLVNLPIVVIALIGGRLFVPTSRDPDEAPLDPVGAVLSIVGLAVLLFAIIEAPTNGWTDVTTLVGFAVAAVILGGFGWWELRSETPMLDLRLFRIPQFSAASGAITLVFFAMFGTFFLLTQLLQLVMGYTALEAGVRTLPTAVMMMLVAPNSARLAERLGTKKVVALGLASVSAGLFFLSTVHVSTSYMHLLPGLLVMSGGMGLCMAPSTASIMASLPLGKAGVGSAVNDTTRELGGALGVAVLGSLMTSQYTSHIAPTLSALPGAAAGAIHAGLGPALQVADAAGGAAGVHLADQAKVAFMAGWRSALEVASSVVAFAAVLVYRYLPALTTDHTQMPSTLTVDDASDADAYLPHEHHDAAHKSAPSDQA